LLSLSYYRISCHPKIFQLNKHKELRLFLKGQAKVVGEIMEYGGISIDWIRGKKAILTIYDDGKEIKDIPLYELKTRNDMHKLMIDEGFQKKTQQQKIEEIQVDRIEKQLRHISGESSLFNNTMAGLYVMVFMVIAGVGFFLRGKKKSRIGTSNNGISRL